MSEAPAKPSGPEDPTWTKQDWTTLARFPVGMALAWLLPESRWDVVAARVAAGRLRRRKGLAAEERALIRRFVGDRQLPMPIETVIERHIANQRIRTLQVLRCHRPGGWVPQLEAVGTEHLEAALTAGRGAIVWAAPFVFDSLLTKMILNAAGHPLHHLSRYSHPYSVSRWGARLLNPIQTAIEDRFLAERIRIEHGSNPGAALRTLARRLRQNRITCISVGSTATETETVGFLDHRIHLATGPVSLARRTGAALLPAFTARVGDGRFRTVVETPLDAAAGADAKTAIRSALEDYAGRLETHVLRWPDQFLWRYDIARDRDRSD